MSAIGTLLRKLVYVVLWGGSMTTCPAMFLVVLGCLGHTSGELLTVANETSDELLTVANETSNELLTVANETSDELLTVANETSDELLTVANETSDELEFLKSLEIARVKTLMMTQLGLTEIPEASNISSWPLPDRVMKMLMAEEEQPVQQQMKRGRLVVPPSNSDFECKADNVSLCQQFEYEIAPGALYITAEFWFQKHPSPAAGTPTISATCSYVDEDRESIMDRGHLSKQVDDYDWGSYPLESLSQLSLWKGNLVCVIEAINMVISQDVPNLPFLKLVKNLEVHVRDKRSGDEACRRIPFEVTFEDIGFRDIVYPKSYQAWLCKGSCREAHTLYEAVLDYAFSGNLSLQNKYGRCWSFCCQPESYRSLRVFHREFWNGTEIYMDRIFLNMIVDSCWCG